MLVTTRDPLIIFVHIPKTGGTSVEEWIEECLPIYSEWRQLNFHHLSLEEIKAITERRFSIEKHYKFSIVRNPYDRAYSIFKHLSRNLIFKKLTVSLNVKGFEDIFRLKKLPHPFADLLDTMTTYLKGDINQVFKYENLPEVIEQLKEKFNFKKELKIVNYNNSINHEYEIYPIKEFKYAKIYEQNKHWISIINEIYHEDFINFGYEMLPS